MKKVLRKSIKVIQLLIIAAFILFLFIVVRNYSLQNQAAKDSKADVLVNHNIGIRHGVNGSEFFEKSNGKTFTPRGMNYTRIDIPTGTAHVLFTPGKYDHNKNNIELKTMASYGYNVVRVFIDVTAIGSTTGPGLSIGFMSNLADFLKLAQQNNIYVILSSGNWFPTSGGYATGYSDPNFEELNSKYLSIPGLETSKRYYADFVNTLKNVGAPLGVIMGYNIGDEVTSYDNSKPLSLTSGIVHSIGGDFDMSKPSDKSRMLDVSAVVWLNAIINVIKSIDSDSLVMAQYFDPKACAIYNMHCEVHSYWPIADANIGGSSLDFIGLSMYPDWGIPMNQMAQDFQIPTTHQKPIIMLEGGMTRAKYLTNAPQTILNWQINSCQVGIIGWLYWTWNTTEQAQLPGSGDWITAVNDPTYGDKINTVLAPKFRSNPCSADINPVCTSFTYSDWGSCINNSQTRTITQTVPASCVDGNPQPLVQSCVSAPVTCTSFTYSAWGSCINNSQNRTITQTVPASCVDGNPQPLVQSCVSAPVTCTSFTYSGWGSCINNSQNRTITQAIPASCVDGNPQPLVQSCISAPIICTSFTYSDWSSCINNSQTRTITQAIPASCINGNPQPLIQSCVPPTIGNSVACGTMDKGNKGKLDIIDFANFARKYGMSCSDSYSNYLSTTCGPMDSNYDGKITIIDFANFAKKYGRGCI